MTIEATSKTAAIAGMWTALGFTSSAAWFNHHGSISAFSPTVSFFILSIVFLFIPAHFLIIGKGTKPFSWSVFFDGSERSRYTIILGRFFVWFPTAMLCGLVWSLILNVML